MKEKEKKRSPLLSFNVDCVCDGCWWCCVWCCVRLAAGVLSAGRGVVGTPFRLLLKERNLLRALFLFSFLFFLCDVFFTAPASAFFSFSSSYSSSLLFLSIFPLLPVVFTSSSSSSSFSCPFLLLKPLLPLLPLPLFFFFYLLLLSFTLSRTLSYLVPYRSRHSAAIV